MKTTTLFLTVFFSALFSCNSQGLNPKSQKDEKKKPHENVTVNRKYDKDGNLIEFDSTYTAYYSSADGDTVQLDSVLKDFPGFFDQEFFNANGKDLFNTFFVEDSSLNSQFFSDDYFEQQFFDQNKNMLRMMRQMDSIKNTFFKHYWVKQKQ